MQFNPPPNWPQPPAGWTPPAGWQPDPTWDPAPYGWQLWIDEPLPRTTSSSTPRTPATAQQRIFISYRRSDAQSQANGLNDGLKSRLPAAKVFMDIDSIPIGADFEVHIKEEIEVCDQVLVVIGDNWLDSRPGSSVRRIDEPGDFVRLEIESALAAARVRIIPVLVEGASMPSPTELPESIGRLARHNAIELSDSRWSSDIERLARELRDLDDEQRRDAQSGYEAQAASPSIRLTDIDLTVLRQVIGWLPNSFNTKDVSQHPSMVAAHSKEAQRPQYDAVIGRVIRENHDSLNLGEPEAAIDDRGALWTKLTPTYGTPAPSASTSSPKPYPTARATPPPAAPPPAAPFVPPPWQQAKTPPKSSMGMSMLFIALPVLCCGLGAFAPALRAALWFEPRDPNRVRLFGAAGALLVASIVGFALVGSSPQDASGTTVTGPASNIGVGLLILCSLIGLAIGIVYRKPPGSAT